MSGPLQIELQCVATGCGATDKVPAYEDRLERDPAKRIKPVQAHPYVCLKCWRAGWRHDAGNTYQLPGHPQVVGGAG